MKDPHGRRPLVEDQGFLDSLNALDRGLDVGKLAADAPAEQPRSSPVQSRTPPRPPRSGAPQPPHAAPPPTPPAPAPIFDSPPPASSEPAVRHRPLLDLFPPSALQDERPPGPLVGTAVGPQLLDSLAPRRFADAERIPRSGPPTCETFYGLSEKPFGLSTDPRFLFHSSAHERVAVELLTAIRRHDGFCLLTGELGVGKTTLCRAIVGELERGIVSSIILEPVADAGALLRIMLVDFGVMSRDDFPGPPRAPHELLATLASFFDSLAPLKASAVVVLDEAHRQPPDVIAQLRALATDGAGAGLLQVVFAGPPSLAGPSKSPLRSIDGARTVRSQLGPLADDEIDGYVRHRLAVAGTSPRVEFDESALQRIYDLSRGVPGVVNLLCDRALAGGFQRSASTIDVTLVNAAAVALDVAPRATERARMIRGAITAAALLALALVGAAGAAWVFRDAVARTIVSWEAVPPAPGPPAFRTVPPLAPIPPPGAQEP